MVYINRPIFNSLKEFNDNNAKKTYTEAIQRINFAKIRCCQKSGGLFNIHGYYLRRLKIKNNLLYISILRIKCEYCGKTHSVFFNDFIPYSMFNTYEGHKILINEISDDFSYEVIEKIRRIKRKILSRLSVLGLRIDSSISELLKASIHTFCVHFLQIHRGRVVSILSETG